MSLQIQIQKRQTYINTDRFIKFLFLIGFCCLFTFGIRAKNVEDPKIYRQCENIESKIEKLENFASDNESYLLIYDNKISSFDIQTLTKNWEFSYSGKLHNQKQTLDKEYLIFTTETISELKNVLITETVLSLKTGIPVSIKQIDSNALDVNLFDLKIKNRLLDLKIDIQQIKSENFNSLPISQWAQENNEIFVGFKNGNLIQFDKNTNLLNWKTKTGGEITNLLLLPKGVLVTSNDNFIYLFDRKKADKIWKKRLSGRIKGLYLLDESKIIAEVNDSEYLLQIDVNDGSEIGKIFKDYEGKILNIYQTFENQLLLISDSGFYRYSSNDCKRKNGAAD